MISKLNVSKLFLPVAVALSMAGCSHTPPSAQYAADANPAEEIQKLDREMNALSSQGGDLLAPDRFSDARDYLNDAKKAQEKGKAPSEVLTQLGYARAQYDLAVSAGAASRDQLPEVLTARNNAIRAGAPKLYPDEFRKAENDLVDMTNDIEKGKSVSSDDRSQLQKRYLNVELDSIKKNRLGDIEAKFEQVKDKKAEKYAPKTYDSTVAAINNANAVITADRTNDANINMAVEKARSQVDYLGAVTAEVAASNGKTSESSAAEIVNQRNTLAQQNAELSQRDRMLTRQSAELKTSQKAVDRMARIDQIRSEMKDTFSDDEAQVYYEDGDIVVRMKQMGFPTGKSTLTDSGKKTLDKVKEMIERIGADKVVVEGYTDTTGSKAANQWLSQARANAVKTYLSTGDNAFAANNIDSKGMGEENPISSNKTVKGRAENRRVDIRITPSK